jgi:PilZ domain
MVAHATGPVRVSLDFRQIFTLGGAANASAPAFAFIICAAATAREKARQRRNLAASNSRFRKQFRGTVKGSGGGTTDVILAEAFNHSARTASRAEDRTGSGRLFFGKSEYGCKVLNISPGGAQVKLPHAIATWATVTLVIESIGALHCRVLWQRGETIALQFVQNAHWVNGKILAAAS